MLRRLAAFLLIASVSASLACSGGAGGALDNLMEQVRLDDPAADRTYADNQALLEVPESIPALAAYLADDPSPKVRAWSALILGRIGDPQAVPALTGALSDADADTRSRAVNALMLLGEAEAEGAFIEALRSGNRDAKITVLIELERAASVNAIPAIAETAAAGDGMVSRNAIDALGGIGDAAAVAPLVSLALDADLDEALRRAAIMNLGRMTVPEASAGLQEVIGGLGEQEGTEELVQLARDQG